jgi:hypothetical protein
MKLPWNPKKLPIIDLSRFPLEKPDEKPWMIVSERNEEESEAMQQLINMPEILERMSKSFKQHRVARLANNQDAGVEFFSRLERVGGHT